MLDISKYDSIKPIFKNLISEVIDIVQSNWRFECAIQIPRMGDHYYYQEIEKLNSFNLLKDELYALPNISSKYSKTGVERPIFSFINIVLASINHPDRLDIEFEQLWGQLCEYFNSEQIRVRLIIGLSNIECQQTEFKLDLETSIKYFGARTLENEMNIMVPYWGKIKMPHTISLYHYVGAIQVDFLLPATEETLEYHGYTNECIKRMSVLREALMLCNFGYVEIGTWISILNPDLPMDDILVVTERDRFLSSLEMPKLIIDETAWGRFINIYAILRELALAELKGVEKDRAVRRRFENALFRFENTLKQGLWESVIVDLIILMESILTPNKQGGRMQLALAASNLLGTTEEEAREVYDNINRLYGIRNNYVHGEPVTQEKWQNELVSIVETANLQSKNHVENSMKLAMEVARDYARRSICAMLNLYYHSELSPSDSLTKVIHRLHLDKDIKSKIQTDARCYSFEGRKR